MKTAAFIVRHAVLFAWPDRWDQWVLWALGAVLTLFVAGKTIQWARDQERRDTLVRLAEDNRSILRLLRDLDGFLKSNPVPPIEGIRSLGFNLRGFDSLRETLVLLTSEGTRALIVSWYRALDALSVNATALVELDERMHSAPDSGTPVDAFARSKESVRRELGAAISMGSKVEREIARIRLGWRFRFWKPDLPEVEPGRWPDIPKRPFHVRLTGAGAQQQAASAAPNDDARRSLMTRLHDEVDVLTMRCAAWADTIEHSGRVEAFHIAQIEVRCDEYDRSTGELTMLGFDLRREVKSWYQDFKSTMWLAHEIERKMSERLQREARQDVVIKSMADARHDLVARLRRLGHQGDALEKRLRQ